MQDQVAKPSEEDQAAEFQEGARFFFDLARWQMEEQISRIDALDRKLAATFTLNGALIALIAAGFTLQSERLSAELWSLLTAVVVVFVLNSACTFLAYRLRHWAIGPDLRSFTELAVEHDTEAIVYWAATQLREACEQNEGNLRSKARWVRLTTILTMVDLSLAAAVAIAVTWPWG